MKHKIIAALVLAAVVITANSGTPKLTPWDAWRMAYTTFEQGEEYRNKGDYLNARKSFDKALEYYKMVRSARPDWNQKVISERIADCENESRRMSTFLGPAAQEKAQAQEPALAVENKGLTAELRKELSIAKAELEELRKTNETRKNYESEISNLLRDQRILQERYSLLEKRYRNQEEKLSLPDTKLRELEDQLVATRLQLDLARKETAAARQQISAAAAETLLLKKEKQSDTAQIRRLTADLSSLQKEQGKKDDVLAQARREYSSLEKRLQENEKQLADIRSRNTALNNDLNSLRDRYREKLASAGAGEAAYRKLADENKKVQDLNDQLRKNEEQLTAQQRRLQRENEDLRLQLSTANQKNSKLQSEIDSEKSSGRKLAKELEQEKINSGALNRELDSMRRVAGDNSAELKRLNSENSELKKRLKFRESEDFKNMTAARAEKKSLKEQQLKLEQNIAVLKAELKNSNDKAAALAKNVTELQSENRKLHAGRINYEGQLKTLSGVSANSRELARRYQDLQKNFHALQEENRQNKLAADAAKPREAELEKIKLRLAELDGLKQQLRREQSFNEQINALKNRLEQDVRRLKPLGEENARLKAQVSDFQIMQKELERLRKLNQELAGAQKLSVEVADLKMQVAKLAPDAAEAVRLRKQNQELIQGKVLWESESAKLKLQLAQLALKDEAIKKLKSEIASAEAAQRKSEKDITRLNADKRTLQQTVEKFSALQTQTRRLMEDQAKNLELLRKLEAENRLLKAELSTPGKAAGKGETGKEISGEVQKLIADLRKENVLLKSVNAKNADLEQNLAEMRMANVRMRNELEQLRPLRSELTRVSTALSKRTDELTVAKKQTLELEKAVAASENVAAENKNVRKLNTELSNRSLKAESELAALRSDLANYNRLRAEVVQLRKLNAELANAKLLEGELAQAKLTIARLEQLKDELVRQRKLNEELSRSRERLEKELASRPMPSFAPADYAAAGDPVKPIGKPEDYISAGRIAAKDEKYDLAVWNYRAALKLAPDSSEAAELLGRLLLARGDFFEAAPMLSRARNAKPESIELALDTAYAYMGLKRYGNAEAVIAPLFKRNKENPQLQIASALIAAGHGQYARAAGLLRLAAARLPADPTPKLELARLLYNTDTNRVFEAVKLYEAARSQGAPPDIELEPKLAPMLDQRRNMTNFLTSAAIEAAKNKDWNSVIWYNKQLIDLDREPEKYRPRLAFAQYKKGSPAAALETLTMGKATPLSLLVKAFIHQERREKQEMQQALQQARAMNNNQLIELPADWREFLIDFRQRGGILRQFAR